MSTTRREMGTVAGTYILTHKGYKQIECVRQTDKLVTPTGMLCEIHKCTRAAAHDQRLFSIALPYLPVPIVCTESYPFLVKSRTAAGSEWKPARALASDDYVCVPMSPSTGDILYEFNTPITYKDALDIQRKCGIFTVIESDGEDLYRVRQMTDDEFDAQHMKPDGKAAWFRIRNITMKWADASQYVYNFELRGKDEQSYIVGNTVVHA